MKKSSYTATRDMKWYITVATCPYQTCAEALRNNLGRVLNTVVKDCVEVRALLESR